MKQQTIVVGKRVTVVLSSTTRWIFVALACGDTELYVEMNVRAKDSAGSPVSCIVLGPL